MFSVEHTGTTMDHEIISRYVLWKIISRTDVDLKFGMYLGSQNTRELNTPYVLLKRFVRTGFGDQDLGVLMKVIQGLCPFHKGIDVALVA